MKKLLSKSIVIIFFCSFCIVSCKKGIPREVIPPAKMEALLYDYHIAKAMSDDLPYDERYKQSLYLDYVLKKYNVSGAVFDSSMVWYSRNSQELAGIYDNVNKRLKDRQKSIDDLIAFQENRPKMSQEGDSVDVWFGRRIHYLNHYLFSNKLSFSIPTDTNFKERDMLVWKLDYSFLPLNDSLKRDSAWMSFAIRFDNDSLISVEKGIETSGLDSLVLYSDSAYKMKEINGFIYYQGDSKDKALLLHDINLTRYRRTLVVNDSADLESEIKADKEGKLEIKTNIDSVQSTPAVTSKDTVSASPIRRNPRELRERRQQTKEE